MVIKPDGSGLGMSPEILQNTPFSNFLIPGLFLFVVNGLLNLLAAILSFIRNKFGSYLGLVLGIMLVLWIIIQVWLISLESFMQPLFFLIGLGEIVISILIIREIKKS
jgi:hypothetical protein